jgi:hypothetical protein
MNFSVTPFELHAIIDEKLVKPHVVTYFLTAAFFSAQIRVERGAKPDGFATKEAK